MTKRSGLSAIAAIAAQCDPERCMVRKCVGCVTFDVNPEECARCYAELYGARASSPRGQEASDGDELL